jgi:DNA modification methylase
MWFAHEPWFETVYKELSDAGFIGNRMVGMWQKQQGQNKRPELYLANTTEMFFYMRKSTGLIQKARTNSFTYPAVAPNRKIHPTERPIEMIADLLRTFCLPGARILVPFLGSGNTILAASNENMQALGFELNQQYKDAYTVRVHQGEPGFYSSYPNMEV